MFLHVQSLNPTKDYELRIEFTNGVFTEYVLQKKKDGTL